jgi:hypothetical protein
MASNPHDDITPNEAPDAGFDVGGLLAFLWRRKWLIGAVTLASFVAAVVYLNIAIYRYAADLKVTPSQGSGGALSGSLGALASLAGADLSRGASGAAYPLYFATLKSRGVAADLASDPAIMRHVFAKQWNSRRGKFEHHMGAVETIAEPIKHVLGLPSYPWHPPAAAELQTYLEKNLEVTEDVKRSMTTIRVKDADPAFAASLLLRVHTAADAAIRDRTLKRTAQYIAYLERKLPTVKNAEQRVALVTTLNDQEKLRMQASATVGFAAEPLNGVEVSAIPVSPRPMLTLAGAMVVGLIAGIGAALATTLFRKPQL